MFSNRQSNLKLSRAATWSLVVGLLLVGFAPAVQAQVLEFATVDTTPLSRFGPVDPSNGYPTWLEDANGLVLELCEDTIDLTSTAIDPATGFVFPPCPACVDPLLDLPDPTMPQSFPNNYPDEHFYSLSESLMIESDNTRSIITMAIEGAFDGLGAVVDGEQVVFARYRVRIDNASPGEFYQITYPYGVTYADAELDQGGAAISNINFTNDIFLWKGVPLRSPLSSIMSTFMTSVSPPAPAADGTVFAGDFCGGSPAVGSPFGTNFFSVVGPNAGMVLSTGNTQASANQCNPTDPQMIAAFDAYDARHNQGMTVNDPNYSLLARIPDNCTYSQDFVVLAKPTTKKGVQIDRATYTKDAISTQINVWASSFQGQNIQLDVPGLTSGPVTMCTDGTGNYFAHILAPASFAQPSNITVTNMSDNPPRATTGGLAANVNVADATYDIDAGTLSVTASATDPNQTGASLSLSSGQTLDATGNAVLTLGTPGSCTVPPASISVQSAQGATTSLPVRVISLLPIALADAGGTTVVPIGTAGVSLNGAGSTGLGLSYSWIQTGGPSVAMTGATTTTPTFDFPTTDALLTFELTVTDSSTPPVTNTDVAIVTNTVVAIAGPDQTLTAFPVNGVQLDGSASKGAQVNYTWTQMTGPIATLIDPANPAAPGDGMASPMLMFPLDGGTVTFELTCSGPGGTSTDSISITAPVGAPVADAGADLIVFTGEVVQLDASNSQGIINIDGTGFVWSQTAGDAVSLGTLLADGSISVDPAGPPNIARPAFTFPATPQTLTFQVVVNGPGGSSTALVNVTVDSPFNADTLTPNRARWVENKDKWVVDGTSSVPGPGHSVTCWFGSPSTGVEMGHGPG